MSETAESQTPPTTGRDQEILAHIEKWMAAVREVSHDRGEAASASTRLDRLLASVTE
jgi:hypothetical protein